MQVLSRKKKRPDRDMVRYLDIVRVFERVKFFIQRTQTSVSLICCAVVFGYSVLKITRPMPPPVIVHTLAFFYAVARELSYVLFNAALIIDDVCFNPSTQINLRTFWREETPIDTCSE